MVSMFKYLDASRLCTSMKIPDVVSVDTLMEFYSKFSVCTENKIYCTMCGNIIVIDEALFASFFKLPTHGISHMHSLSKYLISDMMMKFSATGESVFISCNKTEMKIEFQV